MWQFQQNIFRTKTASEVFIPTLTLQNIDNTTECAEEGEILITGGEPNGTVRLEIQSNPTTEGDATFSYNSPTQNTVHDSSVTTPIYIDVDVDGSGTAVVSYVVDADPNNDLTGSYSSDIIVVDGTNTQIGTSTVSITDNCTAPTVVLEDEQTNVNSCTNCKTVTVNVPNGSTYEIEIFKTGNGNWGGGSLIACQNGTNLVSDQTFTITATETFRFGIDAATGNMAGNTQIDFIVRDGVAGPVLANEILTRTHSDPVQNC